MDVASGDMDMSSVSPSTYEDVQGEIASLLSTLGCPRAKSAVAEIFSPGRFTGKAGAFGLVPGTACDLRTDWDLSCPKQQAKCWDQVEAEDPYLLVGSPICKAFCALQALRPNTPESWKEFQSLLQKSIAHLNFCMQLYKRRVELGRKFLHEHLWTASSWSRPSVREVLKLPVVRLERGGQCRFGVSSVDKHGPGLIRKATGRVDVQR